MAAEPTDATMDEITYKAVNSTQLDSNLKIIADAIRSKGGTSELLSFPLGFKSAIEQIEGGGTEITDGIVVKARDASGNVTEVDYYGDTVYPWTFGAGNENGANSTNFVLRHLQKINFKNTVTKLKNHAISGCMELSEVSGLDVNALTEAGATPFKFSSNLHFDVILNTSLSISFYGCGITNIVANEWSQLPNSGFYNCTSLVSAKFPKATSAGVYTASQFRGCTALQTAELGSVGYGVVAFPSDSMFVGCTQVGLTIVFYTDGSHADTALAKSRAGATNATIIIKASEDTTYNGTAYAAGETMITSEVA